MTKKEDVLNELVNTKGQIGKAGRVIGLFVKSQAMDKLTGLRERAEDKICEVVSNATKRQAAKHGKKFIGVGVDQAKGFVSKVGEFLKD